MPSSITNPEQYESITQSLQKIFDYLISPSLQQALFPLQIVFLLISLGFVLAIIHLLKENEFFDWQFLKALKYFFSSNKFFGPGKTVKKWEKIKKKLEKSETESQWKLCLIEALKFFDQILEKMGYSGTTLTEKLEKVPAEQITNLNEISQIQGTCQAIIENIGYPLDKKEVEKIFEILEKTLFDLEILT